MSHLSLSLIHRLNKTKSAVFKHWMLYFQMMSFQIIYAALRMLHFPLYPIKLHVRVNTFICKISHSQFGLTFQFSIRKLIISLSKTANIVSLSFIHCQLLGVNQRQPL